MKIREIPVLLAMFASTALTSCFSTSQVSNGAYNKPKYNNQIGKDGVRRMANPDKKDIENAAQKVGADGWDFHQHPEHPNNGYLYSRSVKLNEKQELFFRYNVPAQQMDAVSIDPTSREQDQASTIGLTENIQRGQFTDANVEPLFNEAEALAKQLGPTVTNWPRPKGPGVR